MISRQGYIATEIIINKVSDLFERLLFDNKEESNSDKLNKLDEILKSQFDITLEYISNCPFEIVKPKLEKLDSDLLNYLVSLLFDTLTNKNKSEWFEKLNLKNSLKERIMELIQFLENEHSKLSLETCNVKNCLNHMTREII